MPAQVNFTSYNVNDLVIVLFCCSELPKNISAWQQVLRLSF